MSKIKVSIIGATGYVGLELIKLILNHPNVEIKYLISASVHGDVELSKLYPHLAGLSELAVSNKNIVDVAKASDLVFLAVPHGQSKQIVSKIIGHSKIIDMTGDHRLGDAGFKYGLPEIKSSTTGTKLIANPGCFASLVQLALFPLKNFIKEVNILAITGSSGSGKNSSQTTHHPLRNHNVKSYKIGVHQHIPEIIKTLGLSEEQINFVPTSGPFVRGIHLTAFVETKELLSKNLMQMFKEVYKDQFFVRLKNKVELAEVIGSNFCDLSVQKVNDVILLQGVIDNLLKGAAGTAIQNFNLMHGFKEETGLNHLSPIYP